MSKAAVIVVAEPGPPASPCKEDAGPADTMPALSAPSPSSGRPRAAGVETCTGGLRACGARRGRLTALTPMDGPPFLRCERMARCGYAPARCNGWTQLTWLRPQRVQRSPLTITSPRCCAYCCHRCPRRRHRTRRLARRIMRMWPPQVAADPTPVLHRTSTPAAGAKLLIQRQHPNSLGGAP